MRFSRIQEGVLRGVTSGFLRMVVQREDWCGVALGRYIPLMPMCGARSKCMGPTRRPRSTSRVDCARGRSTSTPVSFRRHGAHRTPDLPVLSRGRKRLVLLGFNGFRRFRQDGRRQRRLRHQQGAGDLDAVPVGKGRLSPASSPRKREVPPANSPDTPRRRAILRLLGGLSPGPESLR